ncbi:TetR family transcriptional regulator [Mycolicibacterium neoaurum]|nr:TetR family transcriptional regulator [Mycolicibacterium neoaurum]
MAARELFLADNNTSATVERICDTAGIAPRTFHRHFAAKEDVVLPLLGQYGSLSVQLLHDAAVETDTAEALVTAFSGEVSRRAEFETDRTFLALMIADPQYRLRWLEWGQELEPAITEFLAARVELDDDRFARTLPAHMIIQICRQAYIHWADTGDFENLECSLRTGMRLVLRALRPSPELASN